MTQVGGWGGGVVNPSEHNTPRSTRFIDFSTLILSISYLLSLIRLKIFLAVCEISLKTKVPREKRPFGAAIYR